MVWDHRRGAGSDTAVEKVFRLLVLRKDAADQGGSAEHRSSAFPLALADIGEGFVCERPRPLIQKVSLKAVLYKVDTKITININCNAVLIQFRVV